MRYLSAAALSLALMVPACSQEVDDTSGSSEAASTDDGAKFSTLGRRDGACANRAGKGWLDMTKSTYSYRNAFSIHAVFDDACSEVGADAPEADLTQVNFTISPDDYLKLFETDAAVELPRWQGTFYSQTASATGTRAQRKVTLRWDNSTGDDSRKGELVLELGARGALVKATLTKSHRDRGLFGSGIGAGWKPAFDATVLDATMRKADAGLLLRDDADIGRVRSEALVRSAANEAVPFPTLVRQQQP